VKGVTVLIHDQACAAQTRRERKRGLMPTPTQRVVINHRICEACGDCGDVSNCLSVQPIDTPLGTKTTIDQSTCNFDLSCLEGDCPSFMTVEIGDPKTATGTAGPVPNLPLPEPLMDQNSLDLRMVGIGGTGVVTASQIIATAAMLDGFDVRGLDQTGLSQKAGQVTGDLRLRRGGPPPSNLIGERGADVILGFDLLASATERSLQVADPGRTVLIASSAETPTGGMVGHPEIAYPSLSELEQRASDRTRFELNRFVNAGAITDGLFGNTATANTFLIGVALQAGVLPIGPDRIEQAIELNGVAVDVNLSALSHGRWWVVDPAAVESRARIATKAVPTVDVAPLSKKLQRRVDHTAAENREVIGMLAADLVAYQNGAYAHRFLDLVEKAGGHGSAQLEQAVARGFHKLLAYKDEYEVARLLIGPEAKAAAAAVGGDKPKAAWRLHPPMLKAIGMSDKIEIPTRIGVPAMMALARGKRLRGTRFDPFARAEVRVVERAMIDEFEDAMARTLSRLGAGKVDVPEAIRVACLPMEVRGYEDLKLRRAAAFRAELAAL
jgi:indolepyruvate ferredoxin oxidoreductase